MFVMHLCPYWELEKTLKQSSKVNSLDELTCVCWSLHSEETWEPADNIHPDLIHSFLGKSITYPYISKLTMLTYEASLF